MRRKQIVRIYLILLIILLPQQLVSQDVYKWVYKIRSADNNHQEEAIIQTGFRLKGKKGIITALHGVISGRNLSAKNESTNESFTNLKLTEVDIVRDIALLTSAELLNQSDDGLESGQIDKVKVGDKLYVLGKPLGIETIYSPVSAGNPKDKILIDLIPPKSKDAFLKRGSPGELTEVLYINGALVPGHSGAPLLDTKYQVLGVVDGGVIGMTRGGVLSADICWAIPMDKIKWKDANDEQKQLDKLSTINPNELFSLSTESVPDLPWEFNLSCIASNKDLKELSFHIAVEKSVSIFDLNFKWGLDIGYLIRYFDINYTTLPGLDKTTKEESKNYYFVSAYGGIIPFEWEWFNPSIGVLLGYPWNAQFLLKIKLIEISFLTIQGEWRNLFYESETYSIEFDKYGDATKIEKGDYTIQSFLGLNFRLGI